MRWYKICPHCFWGDMETAQTNREGTRRCVECGYEEVFERTELAWAVVHQSK